MLAEAKAKHLLYVGVQHPEDKWMWESLEIISIDPKTGKVKSSSSKAHRQKLSPLPIAPDDAAYIFFTSGTTGIPKGVLGSHKGLSHFLQWQRQRFEVETNDRVAQLTGISFDVVLRDIFLPLTSGATLCLPEASDDLTPTRILSWLERQQISLLHTVPSLAQSWLANLPPGVSLNTLRWVFFAGEPLPEKLVRHWRKVFPEAGEIVNLYGPTETTLAKCYYQVPVDILSGVQPIGSPLPETQALVLGENNQLCGIGEPGEIVLRTPFRSKGYINASEENQRRFVKNPFRNDEQDLLFYTGDRGCYRPDGSLEILGRLDRQVKIRGIRIELEEIEAVLSEHPNLRETVVIAREDLPGDKRLVAYIVPKREQESTVDELRRFLKQKLPDYMVPSAFVVLDSLPLTPNGKVNRSVLPAPNQTKLEPASTFVAPHDELELQLTKIWEKVLGIQSIGVKDNFFDLGGHSLLAVTLFAQIEKKFGKNLPLATLFQAATVEKIAKIIRQEKWLAPWDSLVAIQPQGSKPPLFYIHAGGGNLLVYRDLALALGPEQPVYGLQPRGLDGKYAPHTRIEDMAAHYLAQILNIQPHGPYFLAGLSTGGTIAWEIAQRLLAQGQKVALLALFDTSGPGYPKLLPPIPRLLSVLNWAAFDFGRRLIRLPVKLVTKLKELGIKQTWLKTLEKLGIIKRCLDEDQKIQTLNVQRQLKHKIDTYKSNSSSVNYLEKLLNFLIVFIFKNSSKPYYANVFASGFDRDALSELPETLQKVQEANITARKAYIPQVYPGRVIFFRASERSPGIYRDPQVGWGGMAAGGMEIYEVPGDHSSIVRSPVLAEKLKACLDKAKANTSKEDL